MKTGNAGSTDSNNNANTHLLNRNAAEELIADYRKSLGRLIFLDYDGTLVPFDVDPQAARPPQHLLRILKSLAVDPANEVVLISGRDRGTLEKWFHWLPVEIVAEHGVWVRDRAGGWEMLQQLSSGWKESVRPILDLYKDRLPGSFVEEKDFSLAWHYRGADPELASVRMRELLDHLASSGVSNIAQILQGNKVVEVRSVGVSKGEAARRWLEPQRHGGPDLFILAAGDDRTDEDLFNVLPGSAWSLKVGTGPSQARYRLESHVGVLALLETLAQDPRPPAV